MDALRQAAQQALEALKMMQPEVQIGEGDAAIKALKKALVEDAMQKFTDVNQELEAALAEPVQEPVAWSYELATTMLEHGYDGWEYRITRYKPNVPEGSIRNLTPLYTAPPQRKPLTEEEVTQCFADAGITIKGQHWTNAIRNVERAHGITP